MKPRRVWLGGSLLVSSAVIARVIEQVTGVTDILGVVLMTSVISFVGGMICMSGLVRK